MLVMVPAARALGGLRHLHGDGAGNETVFHLLSLDAVGGDGHLGHNAQSGQVGAVQELGVLFLGHGDGHSGPARSGSPEYR